MAIFLKQKLENSKLFVCGNWEFFDAKNKKVEEVTLKRDCDFKDLLLFETETEAKEYQNKINKLGYNFKITKC